MLRIAQIFVHWPKIGPIFQKYFSKIRKKVQKKSPESKILGLFCGTPEGTRTPDLLIRSQSLYPTELLAHISHRMLGYYSILASKMQVFFRNFRKIFSSCKNRSHNRRNHGILQKNRLRVCMEKVRCKLCNAPGHQVIFCSTISTA